jgi:hypothetical protein
MMAETQFQPLRGRARGLELTIPVDMPTTAPYGVQYKLALPCSCYSLKVIRDFRSVSSGRCGSELTSSLDIPTTVSLHTKPVFASVYKLFMIFGRLIMESISAARGVAGLN